MYSQRTPKQAVLAAGSGRQLTMLGSGNQCMVISQSNNQGCCMAPSCMALRLDKYVTADADHTC